MSPKYNYPIMDNIYILFRQLETIKKIILVIGFDVQYG